jgi:hypothetical protein
MSVLRGNVGAIETPMACYESFIQRKGNYIPRFYCAAMLFVGEFGAGKLRRFPEHGIFMSTGSIPED